LAEELQKVKSLDIEFIKSGGGVFEVFKDGQLIYSKKATGRFPSTEEILKLL
jgi:selT/selW/selH-like putative selenoprotein